MFQNENNGPSLTPINLHILQNLWLPDVEILDLKAFETHNVLSKVGGCTMGNLKFLRNLDWFKSGGDVCTGDKDYLYLPNEIQCFSNGYSGEGL